jgi:hypothetical protein
MSALPRTVRIRCQTSYFLLLTSHLHRLRAFDAVFTGADEDENNQNAEHFD